MRQTLFVLGIFAAALFALSSTQSASAGCGQCGTSCGQCAKPCCQQACGNCCQQACCPSKCCQKKSHCRRSRCKGHSHCQRCCQPACCGTYGGCNAGAVSGGAAGAPGTLTPAPEAPSPSDAPSIR